MVLYFSLFVITVAAILGYRSIVKKPHGFVEFKTGLILKLIPEINGDINLLQVRQDYINLAARGLKRVKIKSDENRDIEIPTRHGNIRSRAFINNNAEQKPLIVFFHGGGWCIGNIDTHTEQCIRISKSSGMSVISIDYSLAPEHPFPHGIEECMDSVDWIIEHSAFTFGDTSRLILMGDSAGGNISIVTALDRLKKNTISPIVEVVPIYPVTDCYSEKQGSFIKFNRGHQLTGDLMKAFENAYFENDSDRKSYLASPLLVDDLSGFPDTYLLTAEFDPLKDEGQAFAEKLEASGVKVQYQDIKGVIHGFFGQQVFGKKGVKAANDVGQYLRAKYS